MYLPDINLWLALTFESHAHYLSAAEWFESCSRSSCVFCRYTQQGYLRIATNPSAFGKEAVTLKNAWKLYDLLLKDERVVFKNVDSDELENYWRKFTMTESYSPKIWGDAYLAALAAAEGYKVITFDKGFKKFSSNIKLWIL